VDAPADYEQRLRDSKLGDPVLVVPSDFESALNKGDVPELLLISDSGNKQSQSAVRPVAELVRGFSQERIALSLALRGVGGELLQPLKLQEFDLASQQGRAAQFTGMLALFVLMAVVSGALNAALDTTAGERERGSLEPLLMNPASTLALVAGKWAAVASVGMTIAVLSCLSFLPGQWLLQSDSLQAMFQFGLGEVAGFLLILLPFACAISALLMAVAIRSKSLKEAQANTTVVLMAVSLAPMVSVLNQTGDEPWHMWVPALAQNILMMRVLKGEDFSVVQTVAPPLVCLVLTMAALAYVARNLRRLAIR
jgi:sodium transport system permease protein